MNRSPRHGIVATGNVCAIVEERNVNRAAERVRRTQPAVSIALRKLEEELGSPLLHRPRRGTYRLTQAGELLYGVAVQMVTLRNEALSTLSGLTLPIPGCLAIGVETAESASRLNPAIQKLRRGQVAVRVHLSIDSADQLLRDVTHRKIDLAFLAQSPSHLDLGPQLRTTSMLSLRGAPVWMVHPTSHLSNCAKEFQTLLASSSKDRKPRVVRSAKVA